jgi:hypothetical protein
VKSLIPSSPATPRRVAAVWSRPFTEDERDLSLEFFFDNVGSRVRPERNPDRIHTFFETYRQIEDSASHSQLQSNLIEMPSSFIHLISYWCMCERNNYLLQNLHYLFNYLLENIVVIQMIMVIVYYLFNLYILYIIIICKRLKYWKSSCFLVLQVQFTSRCISVPTYIAHKREYSSSRLHAVCNCYIQDLPYQKGPDRSSA